VIGVADCSQETIWVFTRAHDRPTIGYMARVKQTSLPDPKKPELVVPRQQLEGQLAERSERGRDLRGRAIHSEDDLKSARADYYTWDEFNKTLLRRSFSTETIAEEAYNPPVPLFGFGDTPLHQKVEFFNDDLDRRLRELDSIRGQLSLYEPLTTRYEKGTSLTPSRTERYFLFMGTTLRRVTLQSALFRNARE
jgi:hypothetical protein